MALYGIFFLPLMTLLPLLASVTVHPFLDRLDAAKNRRRHSAQRVSERDAQHVRQHNTHPVRAHAPSPAPAASN